MDDTPRPNLAGSSKLMDCLGTDLRPRSVSVSYLYVKYYGRDAQELASKYAKPPRRLPSVLTHEEVRQVLSHLNGALKLLVELLYGSGYACRSL